MRLNGWDRLWVVFAVVCSFAGVLLSANQGMEGWRKLDKMTIELCVAQQDRNPAADVNECERRQGLYQDYYQREHTTFARYWGQGLLLFFLLYCAVTLPLIGTAWWVYRGFRPGREA